LVGKSERKTPSKGPVINGKIILEWILEIWDERLWSVFIWLRIGTRGGLL
jgi:hypothetical protein